MVQARRLTLEERVRKYVSQEVEKGFARLAIEEPEPESDSEAYAPPPDHISITNQTAHHGESDPAGFLYQQCGGGRRVLRKAGGG